MKKHTNLMKNFLTLVVAIGVLTAAIASSSACVSNLHTSDLCMDTPVCFDKKNWENG